MKILMVTMGLGIGGAETHILELTRELCRRGHEVYVASNGGVFVDTLVQSGAHHVNVPMHTKRPDAMLSARRTLSALIRRERFDVIHAHARIPGFIASGLARQYDIPFVTTFHGTFNPVWYLRMLTRVGERALAVSEDVREYLTRCYGMSGDKIDVTVNGIDTAVFSPGPAASAEASAELGVGEGQRIFCVTRLDRESAWHVFRLIEAMPDILAEQPDARLVIIGGGDVLDEVRELAARTDESIGGGRIVVAGPRRDIARLLSAADMFVGVSRAAMEAMACGLPVVLSGAQGHLGVFVPSMEAEAVETNFCCRTREPADAQTLGRAVLTVLGKSAGERREMGAFNRSLIERLYSVGRMADDAEMLYRKALREHEYRRSDVVISGYYGFSNAGDDALLASIADGLRARGIYRIAALARRSSHPAPGVRAVSRFCFPAVWHALRHARLLISGGGSLLQDATSTKSLLYYTAVIRWAKRAGLPVMVLANGIGPIRRASNRRRAVQALMEADDVSVREQASAEELIAMGIPAQRVRVTADPVYRLPAETSRGTGDYVVLSLRETADGADARAAEDAAVRALTEVCRARALRAVLLPMQPRYDSAICARAAQRLNDAGVEASVAPQLTVEAIRALIGGARAVAAMRLHALIFATAAAVPSLALSYDPKLDALMAYLGMEEYVLPAFSATAEQTAAALTRLLNDSEAVSARLRARVCELSRLAEADLDHAAALIKKSGAAPAEKS